MVFSRESSFDVKLAQWFLSHCDRPVRNSGKVELPVGRCPWNILRKLQYQGNRITLLATLWLLRYFLQRELLDEEIKLTIANYKGQKEKLDYFEKIGAALNRRQYSYGHQIVQLKIEQTAEQVARLVSRYKDKFAALDHPVESFLIGSGLLVSEEELWEKRTTAYNYIC